MNVRRLLILLAFLLELAAAAGIGSEGFGSIHVSLVAAGLACFFFAEFV